MSDLRIRRARPDENEAITQLVFRSKRHWGYPEEMIALWVGDLTITAEFITINPVYVAESAGGLRGVFAVTFDGEWAELEHLWVDSDYMGTGLGRQLVSRAVKLARARGARSMIIVSDPHAEAFYLHLGASRVGEVDSLPEGRRIPKLILDLETR
jgi:N-acetylglutamate synthase-like GNAT family acetyltransferase